MGSVVVEQEKQTNPNLVEIQDLFFLVYKQLGFQSTQIHTLFLMFEGESLGLQLCSFAPTLHYNTWNENKGKWKSMGNYERL